MGKIFETVGVRFREVPLYLYFIIYDVYDDNLWWKYNDFNLTICTLYDVYDDETNQNIIFFSHKNQW